MNRSLTELGAVLDRPHSTHTPRACGVFAFLFVTRVRPLLSIDGLLAAAIYLVSPLSESESFSGLRP